MPGSSSTTSRCWPCPYTSGGRSTPLERTVPGSRSAVTWLTRPNRDCGSLVFAVILPTSPQETKTMNRVTLALALVTATVGLAACAAPQTSIKPLAQQEVSAPDAVKVPAGNKMLASYEGNGVQIYQC